MMNQHTYVFHGLMKTQVVVNEQLAEWSMTVFCNLQLTQLGQMEANDGWVLVVKVLFDLVALGEGIVIGGEMVGLVKNVLRVIMTV